MKGNTEVIILGNNYHALDRSPGLGTRGEVLKSVLRPPRTGHRPAAGPICEAGSQCVTRRWKLEPDPTAGVMLEGVAQTR